MYRTCALETTEILCEILGLKNFTLSRINSNSYYLKQNRGVPIKILLRKTSV